jgi:ABC-type polysaccharide/polyol phosphate export permease
MRARVFITPVLWKRNFFPTPYRFIVDYNPFAQFIELLRNPFLGEPVGPRTWLARPRLCSAGLFCREC